MGWAVGHVVVAVVLLTVLLPPAIDRRGERHPGGAYFQVFGVVLPLFVYAFLTGGWVARAAIDLFVPSPGVEDAAPRKAGARMTMNITGRMKIAIGKSIFTGAFCARSSACICRRCRKSAAWARRMPASDDPSWSDASTALAKRDHVLAAHALGEAAHGGPPGLADSQHRQDPAELFREWPVVRLREVVHRRVEAHSGLDRDGELVDEVR